MDQTHKHILENKLSKNLGLLHKAKPFLNAKALTTLYFSFFHSYLTYGNIAWGSTNLTKLKKIASKQRQAVKAIPIPSIDQDSRSPQTMSKLGILNIYKINIYQVLNFMFCVKNNTIPSTFQNKFQIVGHQYPTRFSENNFVEPRVGLKLTKFAISSRGPRLWNKVLNNNTKKWNSFLFLRIKLKRF